MRNRLLSMLLAGLLALGAVACDDTSSGVEEDLNEADNAIEQADPELDADVDIEGDAGLEGEDGLEPTE